ncbi:MAG TPA: DUF3341 domain-containing protein [Polyangiaceae bacterium]|nr:DUF3341 domain-containing protein [Polyangiaceae bacterium]
MKTSLLVEFGDAASLARALRTLRPRSELTLDAYTPYSSEEVREALALPPSRLPRVVFGAACIGAAAAYALEWYTTAYLYPVNVGGRPLHMPLAFVPITFEMGVLAASVTALVGALALGKLVKLWDPVFEIAGFEAASVDRFWLRVDAAGALDSAALEAELEPAKPIRYLVLEDEG